MIKIVRVSKEKAIELLDEKISKFQNILENAKPDNIYDQNYESSYYGTESLLAELFSEEEAMKFRSNVTSYAIAGKQELDDYKKHINSCISQLGVYKERIQIFWGVDELETVTSSTITPFISMSFRESDQDINDYFKSIMTALQIDYETGERYSRDSIPQKVQSRIRSADLFIVIFVKRDRIEGGGYTTPSWLLKELGIAQGARKEIIALVERGIRDIGGLDYEKEVIYFERNNINDIKGATIKFLEALKEHGLI